MDLVTAMKLAERGRSQAMEELDGEAPGGARRMTPNGSPASRSEADPEADTSRGASAPPAPPENLDAIVPRVPPERWAEYVDAVAQELLGHRRLLCELPSDKREGLRSAAVRAILAVSRAEMTVSLRRVRWPVDRELARELAEADGRNF